MPTALNRHMKNFLADLRINCNGKEVKYENLKAEDFEEVKQDVEALHVMNHA